MTRTRAFIATLLTCFACALIPGTAHAATDPIAPGENYVNMGDSYSADAGQLPIASGSYLQCARSSLNWGQDIAKDNGLNLKDVSCSGATTSHYTNGQFNNGVPPQLNALSSSTRLVTMTIGWNDENAVIDMISTCGAAGIKTLGLGNPCQQQNGSRFVNEIQNSTYPNVINALNEVRGKAPNAVVAIAGYLQIMPPSGGCFPTVPFAVGDVPYINGIEAAMNAVVRRAAAATGAVFIDMSQASAGHDACKGVGTRWVEPLFGGVAYIGMHPNAAGERAMATRTESVLGSSSS